jgi:hypothetical protein
LEGGVSKEEEKQKILKTMKKGKRKDPRLT